MPKSIRSFLQKIWRRLHPPPKPTGFRPDPDLSPKERAFTIRLRQLGGKKVNIILADGNSVPEHDFIVVEPNGMFTCVKGNGPRGVATLTDYHVSDIRSITS